MVFIILTVAAVALGGAHPAICQSVAVELQAFGLLSVAGHGLVLQFLLLHHLLSNIFASCYYWLLLWKT